MPGGRRSGAPRSSMRSSSRLHDPTLPRLDVSRRLGRVQVGLAFALAVLILLGLGAASAPAAAQTAEQLMRNRPFAPSDRGLFTHQVYPGTPADAPAGGNALNESQARAALRRYARFEFPGNTAAQNGAVAVFDDPLAKQKIASPSLRAAFAALKGTFAEPAINYFLRARTGMGKSLFSHAEWTNAFPVGSDGLPGPLGASLTEAATSDPGDRQLWFAGRAEPDNPFLVTSIWAHQPLHDDFGNGIPEEQVNSSFDSLFYLHQLARHPELAASNSFVSRRLNAAALARLNSGKGSKLGLFETNGGRRLLPGSTRSETGYADLIKTNYLTTATPNAESPGGPLLAHYLANTHTPGAPRCSGARFSQALLDCIDANRDSGLCAGELIAAALALKLKLGGKPTDAGRCAGASGAKKVCTRARAAQKKAKKALTRARKTLKRAKRSGRRAKIKRARKGVGRAAKNAKISNRGG